MNDQLKQELEFIQSLEGWCSREKAIDLAQSITEHKPITCVEIGVFGGRSLIAAGMALRSVNYGGRIWGVDPWTKQAAIEESDSQEHLKWWSEVNLDAIRQGCFDAITRARLWGTANIAACSSQEAAQCFHEIDWLHIDGSHQTNIAVRDVQLWCPKVRSGGVIWFDDADWPSTQKALALIEEQYATRVKDVVSNNVCRMFIKR